MRIASRWPQDKLRPTRDFKAVLRARVAEAFRNPSEGALSLSDARQQLVTLQKLLKNDFMNKVKISPKSFFTFILLLLTFS